MQFRNLLSSLVLVAAAAGTASAQATGPDIIVHDLTDVAAYGSPVGTGITAFAVGTDACNIGTVPGNWYSNTNQHPVIAQNMYRYLDGRFSQIGASWVKHGFGSSNANACGTCIQPPGGGQQVGVNCSDAYGATTNGNQSFLGPRSAVNAATAYFPWPHASPTGDAVLAGRCQVQNSDLDPVLNAGARYFVEAHYVTPDDRAAGNQNNNATWQEIAAPGPGATAVALSGQPHAQEQGIMAWQSVDPNVNVVQLDVPGDGRLTVAARGTALGGGLTHYEYAIANMYSDQSIQALTVALPPGAIVQNIAFHAPLSHSGEPFSNAPWTPTMTNVGLKWATTPYATNINANALRWGNLYNFSFDANVTPGFLTLDMFKPGVVVSLTVAVATNVCVNAPPIPPGGNGYATNPAAPYDFVDISATGAAGPAGDDQSALVNIGFTFPFYTTTTTQIVISTNGYLCLPGHNGNAYTNVGIPNSGEPNGMIAVLWDDLYVLLNGSGGGSIKYQTIGVAPNRRFVVEWVGVWHYSGDITSAETFEAILDEATGKISSTIVSTAPNPAFGGGISVTRGIEADTGTVGIQTSLDTPGSVVSGTTVTYTRTSAIPASAMLTLAGNGTANTQVVLTLFGTPGATVELVADLTSGPTDLGALGALDVGFPPALVIADGFGVFGPPDGSTADPCGAYRWTYVVGPVGLPSGLVVHAQGLLVNSLAPNGVFDISVPATLVVP